MSSQLQCDVLLLDREFHENDIIRKIKIVLRYFQPIYLRLNYFSNRPRRVSNRTGIKHFVRKYGFKQASNILNSIEEYPSRNMMQLLHSFQQESKTASKPNNRKLLQTQIRNLKEQIDQKKYLLKEQLIDIFMQLQDASEPEIRVGIKEIESWTFHELIYAILSHQDEINEEDFLREIKQFELATKSGIKKRQKYKIIRVKREIMWNYAEKLIKKYNPIDCDNPSIDDTESVVDDVESTCVICGKASKYVIVDCGHYCLCEHCKTHFEGVRKKCPVCRTAISVLKKVKRSCIGNRCAQVDCVNERQYMITNCGHFCLCENCKEQKKCPICTKTVVKTVRIFAN